MGKITTQRSSSVFIQTYGCQMNKYDSEIVAGILEAAGYFITDKSEEADIVLVNTCSVRDHAEKRAMGRISVLAGWRESAPHKKLGVIGCMAQRMKEDLLTRKPFVDFVVGPDEYQRLPELIADGRHGPHCCTQIRPEETYGAVVPSRSSQVTGWVSITRGCNNFCSYCIVPYTRGRERSRPAQQILSEIQHMAAQGFREVTLLGQNVNAYSDGENDFSDLLKTSSRIHGILRIRFMTSHPKDLSKRMLRVMAEHDTICPHLHLPVQSGSNRILSLMNRGYTREKYIRLVEEARAVIPGTAITSDIMVGFPGETESDFEDTVHLMETIRFDEAYTYRYSHRSGTKAAEMEDHLTEEDRLGRLDSIIQLQRKITTQKKKSMIGKVVEVLPETVSKKSSEEWMGKTPADVVVVFPKENTSLGQPVNVLILQCKGTTLRGRLVNHDVVT